MLDHHAQRGDTVIENPKFYILGNIIDRMDIE